MSDYDLAVVPQIQNVVATSSLDCKFNLHELARHARNVEYSPSRFSALILRIRCPKTTALLFNSGKMVCSGAKSEIEAKIATRRHARIIQKLGHSVRVMDFKIQNVVGSCNVQFHIRLKDLASEYVSMATYEPEVFPGLRFHLSEPCVTILIFTSGKLVITGARSESEVFQAFDIIHPILMKFKKKQVEHNHHA